MRSSLSSAFAFLATVSTAMAAVDPIIAKGSHFFESQSGNQFYIKGVAYQKGIAPGGFVPKGGAPDPLTDGRACKRDVKYLQELETNTIRVYSVDPTANHDDCMSTFADAGIYVIADLASPDVSIVTTDPQWTDTIYNQYISVVDAMQKYDNTLGFFAGNEVVTNLSNTDAAAFAKAAVRDTKQYIKAKGYRSGLGVGYSTNDNVHVRDNLPKYFDCGDDSESVDFWGLNIYEWCSKDSTFDTSGYSDRVAQFKGYNKPVFFSEYGCNTDPPRRFKDTPVLLGPDMDEVFSGGVVFEYFQAVNDFGLVKVSGDSVTKIQPDFDNLSKEIRKANPSTTKMSSYQPTNKPASCPAVANDWQAAASPLPPSPNAELCSCMVKTLKCVASSDIAPDDFNSLFSYACHKAGKNACDGISRDAKTGTYGAYSMCSAEEQLSFAFNAYVEAVGAQSDNACDFKGNAKSQTPSSSQSSQCKNLLKEAGPSGTGQVTSSPTSNGVANTKAASSSSSAAASPIAMGPVDKNILAMMAWVTVAFVAGSGMMLL